MAQKYKFPIYIICEVQASKAQGTPYKNCYNSQIGLDTTNIKTQKVKYSMIRSYLSKNFKSHFSVKSDDIGKNNQNALETKFF